MVIRFIYLEWRWNWMDNGLLSVVGLGFLFGKFPKYIQYADH